MTENNRLSGRVKRFARVGSAIGGVAAKAAGNYVMGKDRDAQARELRQALGGLKGPLMKVAQIASTVPDAIPEEFAAELTQLQSNAPAMGWPFVKRRMASELGPDWQSRFGSFDKEAAAAASLGQVHKATTLGGQSLACKLQYPDMASAVEADLQQLKLIFAIYRRYDKAIDPSNIHQELSERLREELDYTREARQLNLYRHMLRDQTDVHLPEVVDDLSTARLLTMTWVDGQKILDFVDSHQDMRNKVALNMFHAWYVPFYFYGVIHGDPHLGNYTVREDGSVNLLDFGCIRVFPPAFVQGVLDLYYALRDGDSERAVEAYRVWGFDDLTNEKIAVLNKWAEFVYAPLMEDKVRGIEDTNATVYGAQVAHEVHKELRKIGGVTPPREFVLMDRAAIGLGSVFLRLKAEINWYRRFAELVEDFEVTRLARRQQDALNEVGLS